MGGDLSVGYLDGLPPAQAAELDRVNKPGLTALRDYLASGQAVAFLGAGVSAPLYPLWTGLIGELVDTAAGRLDDRQEESLRALASQSPEEVVEIVRTALGTGAYREALRRVLRVRTDSESGRSWTPVQELVCRCTFQAVVTTNYDPGIVNARMRVRPDEVDKDHQSDHLYSIRGIWWADFLALTGRPDPARVLTLRNIESCRRYGSNSDVARCDRILGRLALAAGDTAAVGGHLAAAAAVFRDGDYLIDLAATLPDLAEHVRVSGDLDGAERHAAEAIAIAAPRALVSAHCAALAVRARIRATQATAGDLDLLYSGRDAADAAARLAARHQFAWCELEALRAHALLDRAEGVDRGWSARADALHARLVPPGLDPDPLGTVERLVAAQKAAGAGSEEEEGED